MPTLQSTLVLIILCVFYWQYSLIVESQLILLDCRKVQEANYIFQIFAAVLDLIKSLLQIFRAVVNMEGKPSPKVCLFHSGVLVLFINKLCVFFFRRVLVAGHVFQGKKSILLKNAFWYYLWRWLSFWLL